MLSRRKSKVLVIPGQIVQELSESFERQRPTCAYRTSYFMRIEYVSNILSRSEVFAAASIRARRRRDRGAQGRVTATSVGGDLRPSPTSRICCSGISALSRNFLEGWTKPPRNRRNANRDGRGAFLSPVYTTFRPKNASVTANMSNAVAES